MPATRRQIRRGFTLVEAMVAISITAIAGSALLLGIASSIETTDEVLRRSLAGGMTQQMMDEISGKLYCGDINNPYEYPLGPNSYEAGSVCRERYDDIDDYVACSGQPPKDAWGVNLGVDDGQGALRDPNFRIHANFFTYYQRTSTVYYLNPNDLSQPLPAGQTSDYRAIEVNVYYRDPVKGTRQVANLKRVISYVPPQ